MLPASLGILTATATFTDSGSANISLGTVTVVGDSGTQTVTVYFTNTVVLPKNGSLSVVISSLYNAPSFSPLTGFSFETGLTGTPSGIKTIYAIEKVSNNVMKLTNTEVANPLASSASITVNPAAPIFSTNVSYVFTLVTVNVIPKGGYFTLTVPSTVIVPGDSVTGFTISCGAGCSSSAAVITYVAGTKIMTFKGLFPLNNGLDPSSTLTFTVTGWTNPGTFTPANFTWQSYAEISSVSYPIDLLTPLAVTASIGTCTIASAVPTDSNSSLYHTPTTYSVTIKCDSKITNAYELTLTWPAEFYIKDGPCTLGSLNTAYTCTATASTRVFLLKTFTDTNLPAATNFTFTITGIRNSNTLNAIGSITSKLTYSGVTTDTGTYDYPDTYFTPGKLTTFTIVPNVGKINLNPDTYQFELLPAGDVLKDAIISITLSTDISIADPGALQLACGKFAGVTAFTCSYSLKTLKITTGFPATTANITGYASTPVAIKFEITGFTNPATINSGVW